MAGGVETWVYLRSALAGNQLKTPDWDWKVCVVQGECEGWE